MDALANLTSANSSSQSTLDLILKHRDEQRVAGAQRRHSVHHGHHHGRGRGHHREDAPSDAQNANSMSYQRSERTSLYIRTQEGDVVRLKFSTRDSLEAHSASTTDGEAVVAELEVQASSRTKISVKVDGNLNAEELAAIQHTIEQAGQLAADFFAGDTGAAFDVAAAMDIDAEQLARVSFKAKSSERLTYSGGASMQTFAAGLRLLGAAEPAPVGQEPAEGVADLTSVVGSAAAEPSLPVLDAPSDEPSSSDALEAASAEASQIEPVGVESSPLERAAPEGEGEESPSPEALRQDILSTISAFLGRLFGAFEGDAHHAGSIGLSLKLQIFKTTMISLSTTIEKIDQAPVPELAIETIDALAAQHQAPLDQLA